MASCSVEFVLWWQTQNNYIIPIIPLPLLFLPLIPFPLIPFPIIFILRVGASVGSGEIVGSSVGAEVVGASDGSLEGIMVGSFEMEGTSEGAFEQKKDWKRRKYNQQQVRYLFLGVSGWLCDNEEEKNACEDLQESPRDSGKRRKGQSTDGWECSSNTEEETTLAKTYWSLRLAPFSFSLSLSFTRGLGAFAHHAHSLTLAFGGGISWTRRREDRDTVDMIALDNHKDGEKADNYGDQRARDHDGTICLLFWLMVAVDLLIRSKVWDRVVSVLFLMTDHHLSFNHTIPVQMIIGCAFRPISK